MNNFLKKDNWLSKIVGKDVYQLIVDQFNPDLFYNDWKKFLKININKNFFVYSKVDVSSIKTATCLENAGFHLVDTAVQYYLNNERKIVNNNKTNFKLSFTEKKFQKGVGQLAKNSFLYSRFHLDPLIDNKIADKIKQRWAENFFLNQRGDRMVVALDNNKPVGFLQLIINNNDLFIDLIGVSTEAQGKGVASSMILFARRKIAHSVMKVGTQILNIPSVNLYQKLGFLLNSSKYIFHYHN